MLCGAADAVRGASSPPAELAYIMRQSDSSGKHTKQHANPAHSHLTLIWQLLIAHCDSFMFASRICCASHKAYVVQGWLCKI